MSQGHDRSEALPQQDQSEVTTTSTRRTRTRQSQPGTFSPSPSKRQSGLAQEQASSSEVATSSKNAPGDGSTLRMGRGEGANDKEEKQKMVEEIAEMEKEIGTLEREVEERRKRIKRMRRDTEQNQNDRANTNSHEEEEGGEEYVDLLNAMRGLDNKALTSLLMQTSTSPALQTLFEHMPSERTTIVPPAISAGIEGTGTSAELDEQLDAIAKNPAMGRTTRRYRSRSASAPAIEVEDDREKILTEDLTARKQRGEELLENLASFTSIDFITLTKKEPVRSGRTLTRAITLQCNLPEDLGELNIELDVEEEEEKDEADGRSKRGNPRIRHLKVTMKEELQRALGDGRLKMLFEEANLPALLLSVRTLPRLAHMRYQLLRSLARSFSELASEHVEQIKLRGMDLAFETDEKGNRVGLETSAASLSQLVDPELSERLVLRNARGAELTVIFTISFNRWGHARPELSVEPRLPFPISTESNHILQEIPKRFIHLCASAPSNHGKVVNAAAHATIQAFFGL